MLQVKCRQICHRCFFFVVMNVSNVRSIVLVQSVLSKHKWRLNFVLTIFSILLVHSPGNESNMQVTIQAAASNYGDKSSFFNS